MKLHWLALMVCLCARLSAQEKPDSARALKDVLSAQTKAWNDGNIEGYMAHYWKSEQLTFSSGGQTTRGWTQTFARYKKRYSTREKMGKLTFSDLEITLLGRESALMLGRWHLQRKDEAMAGNFSLVFRKIKGKWVIIHDHTSLTPPKEKPDDGLAEFTSFQAVGCDKERSDAGTPAHLISRDALASGFRP